MRIVLDTATFVTAVRSRSGAARELVRLILARKVVALMDYKLGLEYREVALREEHLAASALSAVEILRLIELLELAAEAVIIVDQPRPLSVDQDDDMILDIAINGKADAIVTMNTKHFRMAATPFGVRVLSPSETLELIKKERG